MSNGKIESQEKEINYGQNILNCLEEIRKHPYYKNEAAASGAVHNYARHEDAISHTLLKHGFHNETNNFKLNKKETMRWIDQPELSSDFPNGSFIEQPFGKQQSPDFIIKVNNKFVLFLEAKSSATSLTPTYNSGIPNKNFLYVFCAKEKNQTTIYMGDNIITSEQHKLIDKHIKEARERDEILNQELKKLDTNHRGISYYTRPMINQSGGKFYTNYFDHKQRQSAEEYTINWVTEKCYSS